MDLKNSTSWSPISWKPISFSLWEDVTSTTSFNLADADRLATLSSNSHLWFKASFNRVDGNTYDSGAAGYSGDRKLLALGFEKALVPSFNFGLGFAFGKSDLDGLCRDIESEDYSLFTYGKYQNGNFKVNALAAITFNDSDEDSQVLSHSLQSSYKATSLYGALFAGYDLKTQKAALTPELGLSVLSLKVHDYQSSLSENIDASRPP